MATFKKLGSGIHTDHRTGEVWDGKKGTLLESDLPLDSLFPGAFERATPNIAVDQQVMEPKDLVRSPRHAEMIKKKTRNKQEAIVDDHSPGDTENEIPQPPGEEPGQDEVDVKTEECPFGDDVTSDYPTAEEGGLKVFQDGAHFTVVEDGAEDVALNDKPLKESGVTKFISKHLKE